MCIHKNLVPVILIGISASTAGYAADRSPLNSTLYYDIGGGEVIDFPLTRESPTKIGIDAKLKLPTLCEIWDKKIDDLDGYVDMVTDYAKGELDKLGEQVTDFLITAPATIAVASLQRALPGMYDYSQNLKAQMDVSIDYAKQSCSDVVESMDNNVNPWSGWLTASTNTHWRTMMDEDSEEVVNVLDAEKEINENNGEIPVPWFGADRGTMANGPIHLVKDVISAGFAANLDQKYVGEVISADGSKSKTAVLNDGATADTEVDSPIVKMFGTSADAAKFAITVLGEQSIHFCKECNEGGFTPGVGLKPLFAEERDVLIRKWSGLLGIYEGDTRPPPIGQMQQISSTKVAITRPVWVALDRMPKQDRDIFIYRLISDVAVERTVDKAIAVRQMLKAGTLTPDVQSYEFAKEEVDRLADQMKDEIDDFLWEVETQENLSSGTALKIIQADVIDSLNDLQTIQNYTNSNNSNFTSSQGTLK